MPIIYIEETLAKRRKRERKKISDKNLKKWA